MQRAGSRQRRTARSAAWITHSQGIRHTPPAAPPFAATYGAARFRDIRIFAWRVVPGYAGIKSPMAARVLRPRPRAPAGSASSRGRRRSCRSRRRCGRRGGRGRRSGSGWTRRRCRRRARRAGCRRAPPSRRRSPSCRTARAAAGGAPSVEAVRGELPVERQVEAAPAALEVLVELAPARHRAAPGPRGSAATRPARAARAPSPCPRWAARPSPARSASRRPSARRRGCRASRRRRRGAPPPPPAPQDAGVRAGRSASSAPREARVASSRSSIEAFITPPPSRPARSRSVFRPSCDSPPRGVLRAARGLADLAVAKVHRKAQQHGGALPLRERGDAPPRSAASRSPIAARSAASQPGAASGAAPSSSSASPAGAGRALRARWWSIALLRAIVNSQPRRFARLRLRIRAKRREERLLQAVLGVVGPDHAAQERQHGPVMLVEERLKRR